MEVCGSLTYENCLHNLCLWRVNMLWNCQCQSTARLVGNEGNVIMVAYGKCKCGLSPVALLLGFLACSAHHPVALVPLRPAIIPPLGSPKNPVVSSAHDRKMFRSRNFSFSTFQLGCHFRFDSSVHATGTWVRRCSNVHVDKYWFSNPAIPNVPFWDLPPVSYTELWGEMCARVWYVCTCVRMDV